MPKTGRKIICLTVLFLLVLSSIFVFMNINKARTIYSLELVDEYPLYTMRYYGDYHLNFDPLVDGTKQSKGTNDLAIECSCILAKNEKGEPIFCRNLDNALSNHPITLLQTDAPGKNATLAMIDLFYLGFPKDKPPVKSLFGEQNILNAPRTTIDGVNEYGVAIAMLSVPEAKAPYDPNKLSTDEPGISRIILDRAKTVEDAINIISQYNIKFVWSPMHFMVADADGNSAIIEFVNGELKTTRNQKPWQVCTNFVVSEDIYDKAGEIRYDIAEDELTKKNGILSEEEAMKLLSHVSVDGTRWSIIYNLKTGKTDIVMARKYEESHTVQLEMNNE